MRHDAAASCRVPSMFATGAMPLAGQNDALPRLISSLRPSWPAILARPLRPAGIQGAAKNLLAMPQ